MLKLSISKNKSHNFGVWLANIVTLNIRCCISLAWLLFSCITHTHKILLIIICTLLLLLRASGLWSHLLSGHALSCLGCGWVRPLSFFLSAVRARSSTRPRHPQISEKHQNSFFFCSPRIFYRGVQFYEHTIRFSLRENWHPHPLSLLIFPSLSTTQLSTHTLYMMCPLIMSIFGDPKINLFVSHTKSNDTIFGLGENQLAFVLADGWWRSRRELNHIYLYLYIDYLKECGFCAPWNSKYRVLFKFSLLYWDIESFALVADVDLRLLVANFRTINCIHQTLFAVTASLAAPPLLFL